MCISKIHLPWRTLTFGIFPHPFPLRNIPLEVAKVAKQLANKDPTRQQLLLRITSKPFEQSTRASRSSLGTAWSIATQKQSSRFRLDRAVDAFFRFRAIEGADAEPLETAAPNSAWSSSKTFRTSCAKPNSIVEVVIALDPSEHRELSSFLKKLKKLKKLQR